MKNIFILLCHDAVFALKSKSIYLIFFIPIFVSASEQLLDQSKREADKFKICLVRPSSYPSEIIKALLAAEKTTEVIWAENEEEGRAFLKDHLVQGVLTETNPRSEQVSLLVLRKDSIETLTLVQFLSTLQKAAEKNNASWISEVNSLHQGGLQKQTFATWVLMLVLLVGFIVLPSQVAEEKEKKLILAVLQTPVTEGQWLTCKIILGITLALISVLFLGALSHFVPDRPFVAVAFVALGGYCFSAFGVFLGLLCRHQSGARTLGFMFYLPLLLPSALGDFSKKLSVAAPFLPSYQFYTPLRDLLSDGNTLSYFGSSCVYLFILGSTFFGLSYFLMKKRWLMS
jgi:ABC-2 type transport system permease protein